MKRRARWYLATLVGGITGLALVGCFAGATGTGQERAMKPSITYLHLLRHTPFFTGLSTDQLRWTIDHSQEWQARAGTTVARCNTPGAPVDDSIWVLLDGGWQVEANAGNHPAGHADPGKWFSASAARGPCALVTTERSYVMRITRADMDDMLARGFAFGPHLQEGQAYYDALFADPATQ